MPATASGIRMNPPWLIARVGQHAHDVRLAQGEHVADRHRQRGEHPHERLVDVGRLREGEVHHQDQSATKPAALEATLKNAVTGVGAPS